MKLAARIGPGIAAVGLLLGAAAIAAAQDAAELAALKRWHGKLVNPRGVVSPADGAAALEALTGFRQALPDLTPEQRAGLFRAYAYAALGVADVATARQWLAELQAIEPNTRDTRHAEWLVAVATGDALLARRTLEKLSDSGRARSAAIERRVQRLDKVGQVAPDGKLRSEVGDTVALREREGVPLLLDFWSLDHKPSKGELEALRDIYQEHRQAGVLELLSVNTDPADRLAAAQDFVQQAGFRWPQTFERRTGESRLTGLFDLQTLPIQVLIDQYGYVRAVGDADEPALRYAVRAAVAEARGRYAAVMPKTVSGVVAEAPEARRETTRAESEVRGRPQTEESAEQPREELTHNAEARKLLDQARVYLKTGRKRDARKILEQIVNDYPGTWEAQTAQEYLWSL